MFVITRESQASVKLQPVIEIANRFETENIRVYLIREASRQVLNVCIKIALYFDYV
jgi:hypothetical protein